MATTRSQRRMEREKVTIKEMVRIYCRGNHGSSSMECPECRDLTAYALSRLDSCPFKEEKPTCAKCSVHCYRPEMRENVRAVMRFSGPRMLVHHPILAIGHLRDGFRRNKISSR